MMAAIYRNEEVQKFIIDNIMCFESKTLEKGDIVIEYDYGRIGVIQNNIYDIYYGSIRHPAIIYEDEIDINNQYNQSHYRIISDKLVIEKIPWR